MNTVPDSVLICTGNFGDKAPKGVYGNSQIDTFFNTKVVIPGDKKKVQNPYVKAKK